MTNEELEAIYSGGSCYELAYYINSLGPERYLIVELSGIMNWDNSIIDRTFYHFFNYDRRSGKFIDIYGEYDSSQQLVKEYKWDHPNDDLGIRIVSSEYTFETGRNSDPFAFSKHWEENAREAVKQKQLLNL